MCFKESRRADFSVAIKSKGKPPNPWRWEINRAGTSRPVTQSKEFFPTVGAARKAGKQGLAELFKRLRIGS
jgi:hypothetical protein